MMLKTPRLILREWREEDLPLIAAINGDPIAMRHFVKPMTRAESDAFVARHIQRQAEDGFCMWALEAPGVAPIVGVLGLVRLDYEAHFTPNVEIGWRLAPAHWGKGYATEAARAALSFGFEEKQLPEIVSTTILANKPSWSVMERIGMKRDTSGDFDHPRVPDGHIVKRHILYRLNRADFLPVRGSERAEVASLLLKGD
jgi:RimJ/RimL family protein N-acetyltransferase